MDIELKEAILSFFIFQIVTLLVLVMMGVHIQKHQTSKMCRRTKSHVSVF